MKILVIEACGLHLGYLGCYGNDWVATPNLDRLAAESIVFDNHFIDQPDLHAEIAWAHRSVGTGRYALPGTQSMMASLEVKPRVVQVDSVDRFAKEAWRSIGKDDAWLWFEGPSLVPPWEIEDDLLATYFDEEEIEKGLAPWPNPPLDLVALDVAELLQLQNTYAAVVTVFDAQLGALLDRLRERKMLDDMLLCVTARSGLPLGEHGMIGMPRPGLHDELVHVPLLLRLPRAAEAGLRIAALTQPVDLLPTFSETLLQPIPPLHGGSLWPLIHGEVEQLRPYAVAGQRIAGYENWLMRTLDAALHVPIGQPEEVPARTPLLFLKPEDRWEVNDLYQQQMATADAMEKALRAFAAAIKQPGPLLWPRI
ncbi:MAG: hypothetical protein EXR98_17665 [Gemmataceae bacterium]|nr:hypothetical protein [Gemmataceae bacterium]